MASKIYSLFADAELLRQFSFPLLRQFLLPYKDYLCGKYGFRWSDRPERFPFEHLAGILGAPNPDIPDELRSGLFYIDALTTPEATRKLFERLHFEDKEPNFSLSKDDCGLYTWMTAPGLAQEVHSDLASGRLQKTETLRGRQASYPDLTQRRLTALENDWNACFGFANDKRYGIQVVYHVSNPVVGFQLRHGELASIGKRAKNRRIFQRIVHRPDRYDFLAYDSAIGKLDIYSSDSWITGMYYVFLAKHLFGDMSFFSNKENRCYTLDPLLERGRDALICSDIGGLERALLLELHTHRNGRKGNCSVFSSEEGLFEEWGSLDRLLRAGDTCIQASFLMYLTEMTDPQPLTICTPNATIFNRASGLTEIYEQWLRRRAFACY